MPEFTCPIWGTPAVQLARSDEGCKVDSERVYGEYRISSTALSQVDSLTSVEKAKLTTWIVDQRRFGEAVPHVTPDVLEKSKSARRLTINEQIDRFFQFLMTKDVTISTGFSYKGPPMGQIGRFIRQVSAWTECTKNDDFFSLIRMIRDESLIFESEAITYITAAGFRRIEALRAKNPDSLQGFIAMWFDPSMGHAGSSIEAAIRAAGYRSLRIDQKLHNDDITDVILAEIRRSRFVVADFTCGVNRGRKGKVGISRGGVYFEAGFAKGLGIEVFWTCRKDCLEFLHFDIRQQSHVVWDTPDDLAKQLMHKIGAVIGYGADAVPFAKSL